MLMAVPTSRISWRATTALRDDTRADRLTHGHGIGCDIPVLEAEHFPGAAEPNFHLVDQQHDAVFAAERFQPREVVIGWHDVTAVALYGLDNDSGRVFRRTDGAENVV